MLRHVSVLTFTDEATQEQIDAFVEACAQLPDKVDGVRGFKIGFNVNDDPAAGNSDFAIVAEFDSLDAYRRYATSPAHVDLAQNHLIPIMASRAAVQYEIDS